MPNPQIECIGNLEDWNGEVDVSYMTRRHAERAPKGAEMTPGYEAWSAEDRASLDRGLADRKAGRTIPLSELKTEFPEGTEHERDVKCHVTYCLELEGHRSPHTSCNEFGQRICAVCGSTFRVAMGDHTLVVFAGFTCTRECSIARYAVDVSTLQARIAELEAKYDAALDNVGSLAASLAEYIERCVDPTSKEGERDELRTSTIDRTGAE